ncbi:uncharacterized protein LOC107003982 [Solanum pennellii]|uniref:Uncharacterized protein LOC107003982 n=1 Tax=Solanum pennellii TaxID=28526 RepID=A0ABM1FJ79_SOLPN|nr:uncharacterized protein LOC107003982 [Solanum pennellii]
MGSLAMLQVDERPLARDFQSLANSFVRLDISEPGKVLGYMEARSTLLEKIRAQQFDDGDLCKIRDKGLKGEAKAAILDNEGVLRIKGHSCVSRTGDMTRLIMEKQVKYEHQNPGGMTQKMPITEWKWERIAMDFVVGLPRTLCKFDAIWVIMGRLTKSAHFVQVQTTYNSEKLDKIYIQEIVRLHGVPISIISDCDTQFTSHFLQSMQKELRTRVDLSTAFHPQNDAEFGYNNSYYSSIDMAPFEALYGRRCRSQIGWFGAFVVRPWGTNFLRESLNKVKLIHNRLFMAQSRQKSYENRKIVERIGEVAYQLALPPGLSGIHHVFHIPMLKKYHQDGAHVIQWDSVLLDQNLTIEEEPVTILDRQIQKLRSKEIASVKVQWKHRPVERATWETESDMRNKYPQLFECSG